MSLLVKIAAVDFSDHFEVRIALRDEGIRIAEPILFKEYDKGTYTPPSLEATFDDLRMLMDELWNAGIRPTGINAVGEQGAMKAHLEDMRRLVFKDSL